MALIRRALALVASVAIVALGPIGVSPAGAATSSGYWMLTADGRVFAFGDAKSLGQPLAGTGKAIDIEATPSGQGYWVVGEDTTLNYGDAGDHREFMFLGVDEEVVSISATPSGQGYWLFTNKGRVLTRGDAKHFGDMEGTRLNAPVLDSVATPSGEGYWMVAGDGGIFSFGDAKFYGSMGGKSLNKPVMSMAPDPDGVGYWLVASDGGIFAFDTPFYGSMGGTKLNKPVTGMVAQPGGYLMVAEDGGIFAFGQTQFHGSLGAAPPGSPVVAVAVLGDPPVMQSTTVFALNGSGTQDTAPFQLTKSVARLNWSCGQATSATAGCHFVVKDFRTGSQLAYTSGDEGQSGTLNLHPTTAGPFYVEVDEYSSTSDTTWSVTVVQDRCVDKCPPGSTLAPLDVNWSQVFAQTGTGGTSTGSFALAKQVARLTWSCGSASTTTAGCHFVVKNLRTGSQLDYTSGDQGQSGVIYLHPTTADTFYVEVDEYSSSNDTSWTVKIEQ